MGVRILVGRADGTKDAAAMYDSTSGWMVGPIWEGFDARDQIEAFLQWMQAHKHIGAIEAGELVLEHYETSEPLDNSSDPRAWPDNGLRKLVAFWRKRYVDEDGYLREEAHASG